MEGFVQRLVDPSAESAESLQQEVEDFLRRNRELLAEMDRRAAERQREMELSLVRIEDARRTLRRAGILKPR
jgi:signal-transduction protein with cAMP-binding, CBS, and nucleotidyltransferase domain